MRHRLGLATRTQNSVCKSPFPFAGTAVFLFRAKTVQQRPLLPREVETSLIEANALPLSQTANLGGCNEPFNESLTGTLKPQSNGVNGPSYSSTVIRTLAVDGWAVTFCTARRALGGLGPRPVPSPLYQM